MIEIKNIVKSYDGNVILNNVCMKFKEGKIYGIVGQNGSGKSLLLKIMCGFVKPDAGEVIYDGADINNLDSFPKNTGALLENGGFIPNLTGYENLKLLAAINKKIDENEIMKNLKNVNLYKEKDKKYFKYSLGMRKKLGICQAIMENQKYIILDEPFNGIDKESLNLIFEYLKKLKKQDKIIIITTHTKEDIDTLCDEVYKMEDGKLGLQKKSK